MTKLLPMTAVFTLTATMAATAMLTHAGDIPMGCNDPEAFFDMMEHNETVKPLGVFGPGTGMDMTGELFMDNGITYEATYYETQICVSVAEPSTVYHVSKNG